VQSNDWSWSCQRRFEQDKVAKAATCGQTSCALLYMQLWPSSWLRQHRTEPLPPLRLVQRRGILQERRLPHQAGSSCPSSPARRGAVVSNISAAGQSASGIAGASGAARADSRRQKYFSIGAHRH
jgi:hypothetical protein